VAKKQIELHHADQLWWPERGLRKQDAWEYYGGIASTVLPHLRDRPFTIKQHYHGPRSPYRWLKDKPPEAPAWVPTTEQPAKSRGGQLVNYVLVQDRETLLWLLDYGCVDLHVWTSRIDRPDKPDVVLLDLDPTTAPFEAVVETALLVREALNLLGLDAVPMTTGGDGMHIRIPIARRHTYDQVRAFARVIESTLNRLGRRGVKLDVKMNGHGQQVVAPYSIRPLPSAAVATPLQWDELEGDLDPAAFTPEIVRERIARTGDVGAALLHGGQTLSGVA
jgi:bifunctional non-homologous end joining protein LigD